MVDGLAIDSSKPEVLLRITIENELKPDNHISYFCKKAGQKLSVVARITTFMNATKIESYQIIMKLFAE